MISFLGFSRRAAADRSADRKLRVQRVNRLEPRRGDTLSFERFCRPAGARPPLTLQPGACAPGYDLLPRLKNGSQRRLGFILLCCAVILLAGRTLLADTYHDKPDPDSSGGLVGTIDPKEGLQKVIAVEPTEMHAYDAVIDETTGQFALRGLPPGEYDLLIKVDKHLYEGITLETDGEDPVNPSQLAKLKDEITPLFWASEDYFNIKKIVRLTGTAEHVRMLCVQTRTKHVIDPAGAPILADIRRFDLIDMLKTRKAWQMTANRNILRQEVPYNTPDQKIGYTHSPKLGKILVGEQVKDLGKIDLKNLPKGDPKKYATGEYKAKD